MKHSTSQTEKVEYPVDSSGVRLDNLAYSQHTAIGPFTYFENSVGVGFETRIKNSWFLRQKAGLTTTLMFGDARDDGRLASNPQTIYGFLLNMGVVYRLEE